MNAAKPLPYPENSPAAILEEFRLKIIEGEPSRMLWGVILIFEGYDSVDNQTYVQTSLKLMYFIKNSSEPRSWTLAEIYCPKNTRQDSAGAIGSDAWWKQIGHVTLKLYGLDSNFHKYKKEIYIDSAMNLRKVLDSIFYPLFYKSNTPLDDAYNEVRERIGFLYDQLTKPEHEPAG